MLVFLYSCSSRTGLILKIEKKNLSREVINKKGDKSEEKRGWVKLRIYAHNDIKVLKKYIFYFKPETSNEISSKTFLKFCKPIIEPEFIVRWEFL